MNCLFQARPLVPLKTVANGDIWFFIEIDWNQECCHDNNIVGVKCSVSFVMYISGAKFAAIFLEMFLIQYSYSVSGTIYDVILICVIQKRKCL